MYKCDVCGSLNNEVKTIIPTVDKQQINGGFLCTLSKIFTTTATVKVKICQSCISALFRGLDKSK